MMQGVLTNGRVRLLLGAQHSCYRPRRTGQRHRRSVRGCIVDANLSVLHLIIIKKGEAEIPGELEVQMDLGISAVQINLHIAVHGNNIIEDTKKDEINFSPMLS